MAQQTFTVCTNLALNNALVTQGVQTMYTSSNIQNSNNLPSVRLVVDWANIVPDSSVNVQKTFSLTVVLESLIGSSWFPIAYQFEPYRSPGYGDKRILVLQPDISTFDAGIDDIVWVGEETLARISRQQGKAAATMRIRVVLNEQQPGGPGAFQSVSLSVYGELYDAA